jgi:uncharacterized DUF497 family protein
MDQLDNVTGFDWDEGNIDKNWAKHCVSPFECEEVFFNEPLVVSPDEAHSLREERFYALGKTNAARLLFVVFAVRGEHIRVISARDMSKNERRLYDEGP